MECKRDERFAGSMGRGTSQKVPQQLSEMKSFPNSGMLHKNTITRDKYAHGFSQSVVAWRYAPLLFLRARLMPHFNIRRGSSQLTHTGRAIAHT